MGDHLLHKNRGKRVVTGAATAAFILVAVYGFGIMPFVGLARNYRTHDLGPDGGESRPRGRLTAQAAGSEVVARFHAALASLQALNDSDGGEGFPQPSFPSAACPAALHLGVRPGLHTPRLFGNQCEPWATRGAVLMLQMLLLPGMSGLEWGAGPSTTWYLERLSRLVTVEHNASWAGEVQAAARRAFGEQQLEARWDLHVEPPAQPVLTFAAAEGYEPFKNYVDVAFLERGGARPRFDLISIDGQARVACFQRALWLLRSHGGVLLLNNAQRAAYEEVHSLTPKHWLRFEDSNTFGQTVIWVACEAGQCS